MTDALADEAAAPGLSRPGRRALRRLVAGSAVDSLGTGLSTVVVLLYFVRIIGFSTVSVSAALSIGAALGLLTPIPVGRMADRLGLVRVYVTALCLRGAGFLAYAVVDDYRWFFCLTLLLMSVEGTTSSLQQSLIAGLFGEAGRVRAISAVSAVRNAALGAGTLLGGLALSTGSRWVNASLLAANGLSFLLFALVIARLGRRLPHGPGNPQEGPAGPPEPGSGPADAPPEPGSGPADAQPEPGSGPAGPPPEPGSGPADAPPVVRNARFLALSGVNGMLFLHDSVLNELLPLWMVASLGVSSVVMSALLVVNTVLSVVLQIVLGRMAGAQRRPAAMLGLAVVLLVVFCAVCMAAGRVSPGATVTLCTLALVLLTVGENLHSVTSYRLSFDLAPTSRRTEYMAAFNTGYGLQRVVGPVFLIGFVFTAGDFGWLVLASVFAVSGAGVYALSRWRAARSAGS
ncbi:MULTISPECIES: MFS transporter [Streptomyces]|uniref:MFS transporter n=1 Tax=Streptomyces TaxID=1883 RepID=UPI001675FFC1|nr:MULTISPECIES: MFS transporter [Streptomyces]MBK3523824.1 MFS transporter [Streptomyces sp. MBT70]GGS10414.1 membrane protein [Streptomyces eurythermus]